MPDYWGDPLRASATPPELMKQAGYTADEYLAYGIERIDMRLGDGYAAKHPELLAAFMRTAAMDYLAAQVNVGAQIIEAALEKLTPHAEGVGVSVRHHARRLREAQ